MGGTKRKQYSNTRKKKRKFHGNQFTVTKQKTVDCVIKIELPDDDQSSTPRPSPSGAFSNYTISDISTVPPHSNGLITIDMDVLKTVFMKQTSCASCHNDTLQLKEISDFKQEPQEESIIHNHTRSLQLYCSSCPFNHHFYTSILDEQ